MIRLGPQPQHWIGLSTDAKPIPGQSTGTGDVIQAADVTVGSTFYATDCGVTSVWNGVVWTAQAGPVTTFDNETIASLLVSILGELGKIRKITALASGFDADEIEPDSPMLS